MKNKVFEYFHKVTAIPRGSGDTKRIADYLVSFAQENSLRFVRDDANNVIIFKDGMLGGEDKEPVILQGHTDMVCQQTADSNHDFSIDGPEIIKDGDFLKANKTTLGADNGVAVAIILAILESKDISHPPIEAVFTSDEEIGMVGASALDMSPLKSKIMINIDSEEDDTVTVSCAGGNDIMMTLPLEKEEFSAREYNITFSGLQGGHSGVEIHKGRANANILAGRFLEHFSENMEVRLNGINGGDKSNAICLECSFNLATNCETFKEDAEAFLTKIKSEISVKEPDFSFKIEEVGKTKTAFSKSLCEKIIFLLSNTPDGVIKMSDEISGLVETSSNLGILQTNENEIFFDFSLRSNKLSQLHNLAETFVSLGKNVDASVENGGFYPPWEYSANSKLEKIYTECYKDFFGINPKISAIHAGLECGVFASKIEGLTAISVGPQMYDVHTANERLSISSTEKFVELLINVLANIG